MARKHGDEKPEAGKGKKAEPLMTSGEALMELVKHKKFDELKQRLLATETINVKSDTVHEAFFRSMQPEDLEILDRYFALGIEPNLRWRQHTALGVAARLGSATLVRGLIERGCDAKQPGHDENSTLIEVCMGAKQLRFPQIRSRYEEVVALLLKHGCDPNAQNMFHMTALDYACESMPPAWLSLLTLLFEGGARLECAIEKGCSCVNYAAILASAALLEFLLDHDGNVNGQDCFGSTPLMAAVTHGREANVKLLIERGADVDLKDNNGQTAFDRARTHASLELLPLLEAAGGTSK
jgi:ankyrin repeat protein